MAQAVNNADDEQMVRVTDHKNFFMNGTYP